MAAGETPGAGEVVLPEDTGERVKEWAEGEGAKVREREELAEELGEAMRTHGHDPAPIREAVGEKRRSVRSRLEVGRKLLYGVSRKG